MKRLALVTIVVLGVVSQASGSDRRSLVMFISGGAGQGSSGMRNLCNEYEPRISVRNAEVKLIRQTDVKIWSSLKEYTHIALVGHSLGSHAAYKLAETLTNPRNNTASVLLVTLDPMRFPPRVRRDIPDPHRWFNVHLPEDTQDRFPFPVMRWGHQPNAYRNHVFHGRHGEMKRLFQTGGVDWEVIQFIGRSTRQLSIKNVCRYEPFAKLWSRRELLRVRG